MMSPNPVPNIRFWLTLNLKKTARPAQHFSPNLSYANLRNFATADYETFYFVKANREYPNFLYHILLIWELNFVLVGPSIHLGKVSHSTKMIFLPLRLFLPILKSAFDGSFLKKNVKNSKSNLWFKTYNG